MLSVFFIIMAGLLVSDFLIAVEDDAYFVAHEDEVIYYGSAQIFAETGSLRAESCIDENVSRVGQFNWYGPGYNFIYGTIQKALGRSNTLFIKMHLAAAVLVILVVIFLPLSLEDKLLLCGILLASEQFTCYVFSYFPEMLHLFFSIVLTFILVKLYDEKNDVNKQWILTTSYILFVIIFSLCRITTVFWLAGLLALKPEWRKNIPYAVVFIVGVVLSVIYLRFFIAPPYAGEMHKLEHLYSFNLINLIWETASAGFKNFFRVFRSGSRPVYQLILLIALMIYSYWKNRDRFHLSILFISACLIGVLMAYYTVEPFFFVKQTAMLLPLLIVGIMTGGDLKIKWATLLIFGFSIFNVQSKRNHVIAEHQAAYRNFKNNQNLYSSFQNIRGKLIPEKSQIILWCYNEFDYGPAAQALLPYSTIGGYPIMYTTNIIFDHQNTPLTEKFKLHHKLPVDYILSRSKLDWLNSHLILQTPYFYFYRVSLLGDNHR